MSSNNYFQTSYAPNMPVGFPGALADCGFKDTVSGCALEAIPFGRGVISVYGTDFAYALPGTRNSIVTITGQFVSLNSTLITYNGAALAPVVFNTSHEQTMKNIVTLLLAQPDVGQAFFTINNDGTTTLEVAALAPSTASITAFVTTLGTTQPTNIIMQQVLANEVFFGVAQYEPTQAPLSNLFTNVSGFEQGYFPSDCMNVLRQGRVYVKPEETVSKGDPVYLRITDGASGFVRGQFRKSADGGAAILLANASWSTSAPANGVAVLQLK